LDLQKKILNYLKRFKSSGRILEVGCGKGHLLNLLKSLGYDCYGIEPSPTAVQYAQDNYDLKITKGILQNVRFRRSEFDVIILVDVLEHLKHPQDITDTLKRYLKKDGIIIITTGDIKSINAKVFRSFWGYFSSWEHISFFNKSSISKLFSRNGFRMIEFKRFNYMGNTLNNIGSFLHNFLIVMMVKNLIKYILNKLLSVKRKRNLVRLTYDHFFTVLRQSD